MPCKPLYLHPQGTLTKHCCGSASASSLKAAGQTNQAPGLQAHRHQVARWFCNRNVLAGPAMESSIHLEKPPTQGQCLHGVDTLPLQQRVHGQNHHQRKNGHAVNLNRQTAHNSFRQGNTGGPAELPNVPQCPTQARNTAYIPYTGQALGSALHCHVKHLPHSTSNATTKPTSTHKTMQDGRTKKSANHSQHCCTPLLDSPVTGHSVSDTTLLHNSCGAVPSLTPGLAPATPTPPPNARL